tara:strand:- start:618 stop:842 length:225 start_codon:yes stop_codon:yes gene_type:complete
MNNCDLLKDKGILGDIRLRVGAANESDPNEDVKINSMTPYEIVCEWCTWKLGDEYWWIFMEKLNEDLSKLSKKN